MPAGGVIETSRSHLTEAGMGYVGHLGRAFRIGGALIGAGAACLVHGLIPGLFTTRASRTVIRLHEEVTAPAHAPVGAGERMWLEFEI